MDFKVLQRALIRQMRLQGIVDETVLAAMQAVPRHLFVKAKWQAYAYSDTALEIDYQQTISQPYIVASMTQTLLQAGPMCKVLEIGTGSGYQAAILAHCVDEVYTIERISGLLQQARSRFEALHLTNIHTLHGDGQLGWAEMSPFDGILVTACAETVPKALLDQLNPEGGCMVIPVVIEGGMAEALALITRAGNDYRTQQLEWVRFVPLRSGKC